MDPVWLTHEYFRTYDLASLVEARCTDAHYLEGLVVDGGIDAFLAPWQKHSALHRLVVFIADDLFGQDTNGPRLITVQRDWRDRRRLLPVDYALQLYGLQEEHEAFVPDEALLDTDPVAVSNAAHDYLNDGLRLSGVYEALLDRLADEVFYVMFSNRDALATLNGFLAMHVALLEPDQDPVGHDGPSALFMPQGTLRRRSPTRWAKNAVYHREQGLCATCRTDLGHGRTPHAPLRYDHIVPLAHGGLNDVTNLQLLCLACNQAKAAGRLPPSRDYRRWYPK